MYITEHATEVVTVVKNIQTFNTCFNDHCTLLFYQSRIDCHDTCIDCHDTRIDCHDTQVSGLLMKRLTSSDITARSGSHLVTPSFVVCSASSPHLLLIGPNQPHLLNTYQIHMGFW